MNNSSDAAFNAEEGNTIPLFLVLDQHCTTHWVRLMPGEVGTCRLVWCLLEQLGITSESVQSAALVSYLPTEEETEKIMDHISVDIDEDTRVRDLLVVATASGLFFSDSEDEQTTEVGPNDWIGLAWPEVPFSDLPDELSAGVFLDPEQAIILGDREIFM